MLFNHFKRFVLGGDAKVICIKKPLCIFWNTEPELLFVKVKEFVTRCQLDIVTVTSYSCSGLPEKLIKFQLNAPKKVADHNVNQSITNKQLQKSWLQKSLFMKVVSKMKKVSMYSTKERQFYGARDLAKGDTALIVHGSYPVMEFKILRTDSLLYQTH